jgi:long-chain acyl-CoA synthetase
MNYLNESKTLLSFIEKVCEKYPQKDALIYLGEKFSFSNLLDLIKRFSFSLHDLGIKPNDKILIYLGNSPQFIISFLGIQAIGAIPVPVSPIYTPFELGNIITDCQIDTIICQDTNFRYIMEIYKKNDLKRIIVSNIADLLPFWKRWIGRAIDKIPKGRIIKTNKVYFFKELIRKYQIYPCSCELNITQNIASILYTGGTTRSPKRISSSHAKILSTVRDFRILTDNIIPEGGKDIILVAIPLFHMMGLEVIFGWGLGKGITTILLPFPNVDAILDTIQSYKVSIFVGVPTLYRMILANERLDSYNLDSLKFCWSGGDILSHDIFNRWNEKFHLPIYQIYGTTETGCITLSPLDQFPEPGSIGLPIPSKKIKIIDPNTLEELSYNQVGVLMATSENLIEGYSNNRKDIFESYIEKEGYLWHLTEDYVRMDNRGILFYIDRSADMIKYKGYRISCSEIEMVLQSHPAVKEACVIGISNPDVGELIKAIVILKGGTKGVSSAELIKWCREKLAPYKIPDYIEFRDSLPKSKIGKLLRQEIRDEEQRRWGKKRQFNFNKN